MTDYELLSPDMDAQVNSRLGDSISFELKNGTTVVRTGFLILDADAASAAGIDPAHMLWHIKIDKVLLPGGPDSVRRISHPRLDGPYKPSTDTKAHEGAAWLFDLQKARP